MFNAISAMINCRIKMIPSLESLFEDNHVLIVNKPAGLLTQPNETGAPSLEAELKDLIKQRDHKPGQVFLHAVHRLDKPASGIILFAKTSKALSRLNASFHRSETEKIYCAIVEGAVFKLEGTLEHFLFHDEFYAKVVDATFPGAKQARLHYRVSQSSEALTALEIQLETGRYHQIRAQWAAVGFPILGDRKYGSKRGYFPEAIALHHHKLRILHPTLKTLLSVTAPLPSQFLSLMPF
jgi:23S rRNA pseudouridine1911/1915/1917 synthase